MQERLISNRDPQTLTISTDNGTRPVGSRVGGWKQISIDTRGMDLWSYMHPRIIMSEETYVRPLQHTLVLSRRRFTMY